MIKKKIISITNLSISADSGLAAEIRINFIHKGLKDADCLHKIYSSQTNYIGKNNNYIFKNLSKASFLMKLMFFICINPFVFFLFLMRTDRQSVIMIDKLPMNLVVPFFLFKIIKNNRIISIYNEFFVQNVKQESTLHNVINNIQYKLWIVLLRCTNVLIVISDEHATYFKRYLPNQSEIVVIPMLLNYKMEEDLKIKKKREIFCICYAGALSESNGVEILIQAVSYIKDHHPILLTMFGPSLNEYRSYLDNIIRDLNISDYVHLGQARSNTETKQFLKTQDLLVIPKLEDDRALGYIPSKLGDFLYSKTPVLVSDVGEISKHIKDGDNGYLFNPNVKNDLSIRILSIINDSNSDIGENGYLYSGLFHYSNQVKSLLKVI